MAMLRAAASACGQAPVCHTDSGSSFVRPGVALVAGAGSASAEQPPSGSAKATAQDPYAWLRDDSRSNPSVNSYLTAETEYARAVLSQLEARLTSPVINHLASLAPDTETHSPCVGPPWQQKAASQARRSNTGLAQTGQHIATGVTPASIHVGGTKHTGSGSGDSSTAVGALPNVAAGPAQQEASATTWWYQSVRGPGDEYWRVLRWPVLGSTGGPPLSPAISGVNNLSLQRGSPQPPPHPQLQLPPETAQVVLDPNSEADAGDHSYYDVGHHAVSPDGTRVAWTVDTVGDERYTLVVKHLGLPVVNQGSNIPGESPMSGTPDGSPASTPLQPCIPAVKAVGDAAGSAMLEQGTPISCQTQPGNNSMVLGAPSSEDGSNSSMPGAACDDGNKSTDKVSSHGGEYLVKPGTVHTVGPNLVWSQDGQSVLVMRVTHTTHVPYQVLRVRPPIHSTSSGSHHQQHQHQQPQSERPVIQIVMDDGGGRSDSDDDGSDEEEEEVLDEYGNIISRDEECSSDDDGYSSGSSDGSDAGYSGSSVGSSTSGEGHHSGTPGGGTVSNRQGNAQTGEGWEGGFDMITQQPASTAQPLQAGPEFVPASAVAPDQPLQQNDHLLSDQQQQQQQPGPEILQQRCDAGHESREKLEQGQGAGKEDRGVAIEGRRRVKRRRRRRGGGGCGLSWMGPTSSGRWLLVKASSQGGCELRAVPLFSRKAAAEGACGWAALQPQLQGQLQEKGWMTALQWQDEYSVLQAEDWGQWLLLLVDSDDGPDGQVVAVPLGGSLTDPRPITVVPPGAGRYELRHIEVTPGHLTVTRWERMAASIDVYQLPVQAMCDPAEATEQQQDLPRGQSQPVGGIRDKSSVVVSYSSLAQPQVTLRLDLSTWTTTTLHVEEVGGGFDSSLYTCSLLWAQSADGTQVPISLAYRRDLMRRDGSNPCVMHAYGAYGSRQDPSFSRMDLPLMDWGAVVAIAHVRGGGELGAAWHTGAMRSRKPHTFHDVLACARALVAARLTTHNRLALWGRSAGGLAIAAAVHMDPSVCAAALLDVPFLDVLGSMCDPSLPLTLHERREWGDPLESEEVYDRIAGWSPYETLPDAVARGAALAGRNASGAVVAEDAPASKATRLGPTPAAMMAGLAAPPPAGPPQEADLQTGGGPEGGGSDVGQRGCAVVWPHMLVTGSLHDERVPVWGPAKYVARLRALLSNLHQQAHDPRRSRPSGHQEGLQPEGPAAAEVERCLGFRGQAKAEAVQDVILQEPGSALRIDGQTQGAGASNSSSSSCDVAAQAAGISVGGSELPVVLLEVDMEAGHFSGTGAGGRLRSRARKTAFVQAALS